MDKNELFTHCLYCASMVEKSRDEPYIECCSECMNERLKGSYKTAMRDIQIMYLNWYLGDY